MYEQFMGDFTYRDSESRQVQLFIGFREFSSNQPSLHLLYFTTYSGIKNSLSYPKHMLRAHYISMCLATLFVSSFVNRSV